MSYISRKEAAELLHVHPQTISNYIKAGLVRRDPNTVGNVVRVLEDDIKNLIPDTRDLETLQTTIKDYRQKLKGEQERLERTLEDVKREIVNTVTFSRNYHVHLDMIIQVIRTVSCLSCNPLSEREASILEDMLMFHPLSEIAEKNNLSRDRVRQIGMKALRRFNWKVIDGVHKNVKMLETENEDLKKENDRLKRELAILKKYRTDKVDEEINSVVNNEPEPIQRILDTKLKDAHLSVRAFNILKCAEIETVRDLVKYTRKEIKRFRNLGNKSLAELDDYIEECGLYWGACDKAGNLKNPLNEKQLASMSGHGNETDVATKQNHPFTYGGLKIKFAPGNLYWDGTRFRFEEHQWDCPNRWNPKHIGHFFWNKDAAKARATEYDNHDETTDDKFFAADGGAVEGWTVLSEEQWRKVIKNCLVRNKTVIAGKCCAILKPDGTEYEVKDSYSTDEWKEAERHGLVALPFAGYRYGSDFYRTGSYGYYWSSTPNSDREYWAWYANFYSFGAYTDYGNRYNGRSVRLVSVQ